MSVLPKTGPLAARRAGVLLHLTSLPSPYGPGDVGPAAYAFVDFLASAGCSVWQVLPLVPAHAGEPSPYNALSAMAGNPELISLELLRDQGLLDDADLAAVADGTLTRGAARQRAADAWERGGDADPERIDDFELWAREHQDWLTAYVEFVALAELVGSTEWRTWDPALRDREPTAVAELLATAPDRVRSLRWEQYAFDVQWTALREYAEERGVLVFGDLPIFVSFDSADVWSDRDLFELDATGRPTTVTGCPPDYFAADGQRWNNPHYAWQRMAADGFGWWRRRVLRQRELFDLVRIDHFRGFEAAWHIPVDAPTAATGEWLKSPGRGVLSALLEVSGEGTLVAEDLGLITPEVDELREEFGLPGMKVLQFAFDGNDDNPYLPERHGELSVVYTGTHDNDTTLGWWRTLDDASRRRALDVLAHPEVPMPWSLVHEAFRSTARLAVVPAQDLLGLGSEARMNTPGTAVGNWTWQAPAGAFPAGGALAARLRTLVDNTGRAPRRTV
ncbi:4-alpha-glucanotransferase [Nocardioides sp. HDW12B]|uniref:4-alpha-glucanotransferase n=1 Tax=Nocardioides sp. HDW12B TaxID=2714939 RepID=UPI00140BE197|nr:4-alpha-glucanotransferase [Nocardioides sp. HDW12B]QIK68190.1 4-alpha-glucanotransferase [Nocardioides sp. HDW12B]